MKRLISKNKLNFLENEMKYCEEFHIINKDIKNQILEIYETQLNIDFIKIIITVGSTFIGLSVLGFVANQWEYMSGIIKVILFLSIFIFSLIFFFFSKNVYPKTSSSLLYLIGFVLGVLIIVAGQLYDLYFSTDIFLLIWSASILSMSIIFKNKILFLFSQITIIIYSLYSLYDISLIYPGVIVLSYYLTNKYLGYPRTNSIINVAVFMLFLMQYFIYWETNTVLIIITYMIIGLYLYLRRFNHHNLIFEYIGFIVSSLMAVMLTSREAWQVFLEIPDGNNYAVLWGLVLGIYFLIMIKHKSYISLFFFSVLIFRFYFDMYYSFIPRSILFFLGGIVLLGLGLNFDRTKSLQK